jgi:hypothetical protein
MQQLVTLHAGKPGLVVRPGIAVRGRALDLRSERAWLQLSETAGGLVCDGRLAGPARVRTKHGRRLIVPASATFPDALVHVAVEGEASVVAGVAKVWYRGELVQLHPGALVEYERVVGDPWMLAFDGHDLAILGCIRFADARRTPRGEWHRADVELWAAQAEEGERLPSLVTGGLLWVAVRGRPVPIRPSRARRERQSARRTTSRGTHHRSGFV